MRRLLLCAILGLLLTVRLCSAAIGAGAMWEVRPTNGDNTFGAGFDSTIPSAGTDYTQQTTAQLSLTDITHTGGSTTITSVTGGFTAAMIGNALRMNSGTNVTVGWYFITGVTDTNTATLDRSMNAGSTTNGAGKVGGATQSISLQATTTLGGVLVAGNTVYVKNEAWNEAIVLLTAGSLASPLTMEGYNTTRGDAPTGSNRPHNNKAGVGVPLTAATTSWLFRHLWFSHSAGKGVENASGSLTGFVNVRSSNNATIGFNLGQQTSLVGCEADTNTQTGVTLTGTPALVYASYIHGNTTNGINVGGFGSTIVGNIITANAANGINNPGAFTVIIGNTVDGNTGASTDGIGNGNTNTTSGSVIMNNVFSNNGRDGARYSGASNGIVWDYNDYYGNAGTARTNVPTGTHDLALDPSFTNSAGGNYAIGANLRAQGSPGVFPASTSTGSLDIGAVQSGQGAITQGACHRTTQ
jgi:hypothetical protein